MHIARSQKSAIGKTAKPVGQTIACTQNQKKNNIFVKHQSTIKIATNCNAKVAKNAKVGKKIAKLHCIDNAKKQLHASGKHQISNTKKNGQKKRKTQKHKTKKHHLQQTLQSAKKKKNKRLLSKQWHICKGTQKTQQIVRQSLICKERQNCKKKICIAIPICNLQKTKAKKIWKNCNLQSKSKNAKTQKNKQKKILQNNLQSRHCTKELQPCKKKWQKCKTFCKAIVKNSIFAPAQKKKKKTHCKICQKKLPNAKLQMQNLKNWQKINFCNKSQLGTQKCAIANIAQAQNAIAKSTKAHMQIASNNKNCQPKLQKKKLCNKALHATFAKLHWQHCQHATTKALHWPKKAKVALQICKNTKSQAGKTFGKLPNKCIQSCKQHCNKAQQFQNAKINMANCLQPGKAKKKKKNAKFMPLQMQTVANTRQAKIAQLALQRKNCTQTKCKQHCARFGTPFQQCKKNKGRQIICKFHQHKKTSCSKQNTKCPEQKLSIGNQTCNKKQICNCEHNANFQAGTFKRISTKKKNQRMWQTKPLAKIAKISKKVNKKQKKNISSFAKPLVKNKAQKQQLTNALHCKGKTQNCKKNLQQFLQLHCKFQPQHTLQLQCKKKKHCNLQNLCGKKANLQASKFAIPICKQNNLQTAAQ